jgi:DNA-binding protein YbaB
MDIDFDAVMARLDQQEAALAAAEQHMAESRSHAGSPSRVVEVTVDAAARMTRIDFGPTARQCTPAQLGREIVQAAESAARTARESNRAALAEVTTVTRALKDDTASTPSPSASPAPPVQAWSADQLAAVTVDAGGSVRAVEITTAAMSRPLDRLAAAIVEAAQLAVRRALDAAAPVLADTGADEALDSLLPPSEPQAPPKPQAWPTTAPAADTKPVRARGRTVDPVDWNADSEAFPMPKTWLV